MVGRTLGHYKILELLGKGGMGEVYRAEDSTLKREVALKILPEELASSRERLERFQREAETLAALDHPNIVTIHSVEEAEGVHFLTMQLVKGQRLTDSIDVDGMPLDGILEIAIPLASALADAHEHGVIHRDLKPSNIMISDQGRVKILDFGLAKLNLAPESKLASQLPTEPLTEEGRLLGTAPYMSPEQIEGKPLDSRSDIFSLGIILYEMASGRRPFEGESSTSVMAKILETEPEQLGERRPDLPPELVRIVRRCLRKNPEDRYNDTRDLQVALRDLREDTISTMSVRSGASAREAPIRTARFRPAWIVILAIVVLAAAVGLSWLNVRPTTPPPVAAPPEHQQLTFSGQASSPAISNDGNWIAYVETRAGDDQRVMVQEIAAGQAVEIFQASQIFEIDWSPDGSELVVAGWLSEDDSTGNFIVPRLGGSSRSIGFRGFGLLSWSPDGERIAGTGYGQKEIWLMDADSGATESIQLAGTFEWLHAMDWSPSGRFLLVVTADAQEIYSVEIVSENGAEQHRIVKGADIFTARWAGDDGGLYYAEMDESSQRLIKTRIDLEDGKHVGQPQTLLTGLEWADLDISPAAGRLVHAAVSYSSNLWEIRFEAGPQSACRTPKQLTFGTSANEMPEYSPDGEFIAFLRGPGTGAWKVHVLSLDDSNFRQVDFSEGDSWKVAWSGDSKELGFILEEDDRRGLWIMGASGENPRVLGGTPPSGDLSWSPGDDILYQTPGNRNFNLLDAKTGKLRPLLTDDSLGWVHDAVFSPGADHVAFYWVRKPGDAENQGLWVIGVDGGAASLAYQTLRFLSVVGWSDDARWIYALSGDFDQHSWLFGSPELIRVAADGSSPPEHVCALPVGHIPADGLDISEARKAVVASVGRSESDIWLVSNFDPGLD